jgi:hypothetical protein
MTNSVTLEFPEQWTTATIGTTSPLSTPKIAPIFLAVSDPPGTHKFTAAPSTAAAAYPSQPEYPQAPQFAPGRTSRTWETRSSVFTAKNLDATARHTPEIHPIIRTTIIGKMIVFMANLLPSI